MAEIECTKVLNRKDLIPRPLVNRSNVEITGKHLEYRPSSDFLFLFSFFLRQVQI